ncbi:Dps family protein [Halarcobacter anaerophilus]|uniref:DNA starvation/stationary phase protection protein n=1 Tax=Halarcobacter anaerophilus TaxID=877500 RepID=A0A4Q0Y4F7_9BACT|nr:DNA starvation/stationary phase protection protein [Halarcobacter anaerophilus]QDF27833.1 DNA-binding ferritin-like protein [Halarcobacter anaerophilus]RXJ64174.1 DNA starvation/stationary phase protection protein [Halarcobacter anaerophilus]
MLVVEQLKTIQANALVMYVKLHNLHWNVKGMQFYAVHEMTESMYNKMAEIYDDTAERVLQVGEKPYVTINDALKVSKIEEDKRVEFSPKEVLEIVLNDYKTFLNDFKELSIISDDIKDTTTVAFSDEQVAKLEKDIWMIKASLS